MEKRSTTPPLELLPKEDRLKLAAEGYAVPLDDIKVDKVNNDFYKPKSRIVLIELKISTKSLVI